MSDDRKRPDVQPDLSKDKDAQPGVPKQALSGGGFEHAGSDEGGSAYGDDREDEADPKAPEGGFTDAAAPATQPAEEKTFAPDGEDGAGASTEAVTNTGEPRPVKNGEGVEGQPGDDVDAATG